MHRSMRLSVAGAMLVAGAAGCGDNSTAPAVGVRPGVWTLQEVNGEQLPASWEDGLGPSPRWRVAGRVDVDDTQAATVVLKDSSAGHDPDYSEYAVRFTGGDDGVFLALYPESDIMPDTAIITGDAMFLRVRTGGYHFFRWTSVSQ